MRDDISSDDLRPNTKILGEPEMEAVRGAVFCAVENLIDKGYSRAEVLSAIHSDTHMTALQAFLKLRARLVRRETEPKV